MRVVLAGLLVMVCASGCNSATPDVPHDGMDAAQGNTRSDAGSGAGSDAGAAGAGGSSIDGSVIEAPIRAVPECAGTAAACSLRGQYTCALGSGCHLEGACTGEAVDCGLLATSNCEAQPGCYWNCAHGASLCGDTCVDLENDEAHCGDCGFDCGPGGTCGNGACTCRAPYAACGGRCVDTGSDAQHCGACGKACGAGFNCEKGVCVDIDDCTPGACKDGRACEDKTEGFVCGPCPAGYEADSDRTCADVDECAIDNGGCAAEAACTNTPGSHSCGPCPSGYSGSGKTVCVDIDECATDNGGCGKASAWKCTNTKGSRTCSDIDECAANNGGCGNATAWTCTNTPGSHACTDIDECAVNNGGCDALASCTNTLGGRACGACPSGYTGDGTVGCSDVDECATNNGGCGNAAFWHCANTPGSHTCNDIDECATNHGGCDPVASCSNSPGGYSCGACPGGYTGDGYSGCSDIDECAVGNGGCGNAAAWSCANTPGSHTCNDIDECAVNNGGCGSAAAWTCTNNPGGYTCSDINECAFNNGGCGNVKAWKCVNSPGSYACSDIDECAVNNGGCGSASAWKCINSSGSYACSDIDECATNHGGCDALASCTNSPGSYSCGACPGGYAGNGYAGCTDIDECAANNGGCGSAAAWQCTNTLGSYTCKDVDECATNNGGCDALTTCMNTSGGRSCTACPAGYVRAAGTDDVCVPALSALGVAPATLSPSFDPAVTSYSVRLPLSTPTIALTPSTTAAGSMVTINGATVGSGSTWTSPTLNLGPNNTFTITISQAGRSPLSYTVNVERGYQEAYIKASNTTSSAQFGGSVSLSTDGNTMAVSAVSESSGAIGIGGNQVNQVAPGSGAVYVFVRSGAVWSQQAYIKASNTEANDLFGSVVELSADGNTLAVSAYGEDSAAAGIGGDQSDNAAPFSGAAYVFTRSGSTWSQQAYIKASNTGSSDDFGLSMALSADGNTLAVGAYHEDSAANGIGGNQADNSQTDSGAVYVFTRTGSAWSQQAYVKASNTQADDFFGVALALSGDGNTLAVGATGEDSSATGIGGNQLNGLASVSGAVYVFLRSGSAWSQQAYVKASNTDAFDNFGGAVGLSSDGNTLAVGAALEAGGATGIGGNEVDNSAANSGAVYVFTRAGASWSQQVYVKASNAESGDSFGGKVVLSPSGDTLGVGAVGENSAATGIGGDQADNSAAVSGAAYVFTRVGANWSQLEYIKSSNAESDDRFGFDIAISAGGDTIVVSGYREDSSAIGVNGDQADNSASAAGAIYVFR